MGTKKLKNYLIEEVEGNLDMVDDEVQALEMDLTKAEKFNEEYASYIVEIELREAGTGLLSIKVLYTGSLADAIQRAEETFHNWRQKMLKNSPVYKVEVELNQKRYELPSSYWKKHIYSVRRKKDDS